MTFLILFFLLKKFAFGPIQNMIDTRRDAIEESIKAAEATRLEAERMESQINQLKQEFAGEDLAKNIQPLQAKLKKAEEAKEKLEPEFNSLTEEITAMKTDCGVP